jgi:hypothetical protein
MAEIRTDAGLLLEVRVGVKPRSVNLWTTDPRSGDSDVMALDEADARSLAKELMKVVELPLETWQTPSGSDRRFASLRCPATAHPTHRSRSTTRK